LDEFLNFPRVDPHGDPIPDKNGKFQEREETFELQQCLQGDKLIINGVSDTSSEFLVYLREQGLTLGTRFKIIQVFEFDKSMSLELKNKERITVSQMVTRNILVQKV
jgi:DtxR family Mn-dependent transcriptional regulator